MEIAGGAQQLLPNMQGPDQQSRVMGKARAGAPSPQETEMAPSEGSVKSIFSPFVCTRTFPNGKKKADPVTLLCSLKLANESEVGPEERAHDTAADGRNLPWDHRIP